MSGFATSHGHNFYSFGTDHMTPLVQYGSEWRMHRKLLHPSLRHDVGDRYHDLHLGNAHRLLENMRSDSTDFGKHFEQYVLRFWSFSGDIMRGSYTGASALEFIYGRRVDRKDDPVVKLVCSLAEALNKEMTSERMGLFMALPIREYDIAFNTF